MNRSSVKSSHSSELTFFSYAKEDRQRVLEVYRQLRAEGLDAWIDVEDLLPGQDWELEILSKIKVARFVLVFLSQNSVSKRGYIQKEISRALDVAQQIPEGEIFVIPVRLEVCSVPTRLQRWHWLDIFEPDGLERLLNVLRTTLEQEIPSTQAGGQERPWQAPPGALDLLLVNRCLERKTFVYGILPSGGVIISDGAFLEVREAIPTYFHGLEKKVKHSGEVSEASLTSSLPSATTYRKRSHLLKDIALDPSNPRLRVITTEGGLQCHVDSLYLDYVMVKYPTAHIYAHEPEKPIMIEEEQRLRAAIMPIRVTGD